MTIQSCRSPIRKAVLVIIVVVVLWGAAVVVAQRAVNRNVLLITRNAMESTRAVQRLSLDLENERWLVESHIQTTDDRTRASLERQVAASERDFDATARLYAPLATFPGERVQWHQFAQVAAELRARFAQVLALSREGRASAANVRLKELPARFPAANSIAERVTRINEVATNAAVSRISNVHFTLDIVVLASAILIMALCTAISVSAGHERNERLAQETWSLELRNKELDAFSGRVAHDIRGPLAIITLAGGDPPLTLF